MLVIQASAAPKPGVSARPNKSGQVPTKVAEPPPLRLSQDVRPQAYRLALKFGAELWR